MMNYKMKVLLTLVFFTLISLATDIWDENGNSLLYGQNSINKISENDSLVYQEYNDGPYLFYRQDSIEALWICEGKVLRKMFLNTDTLSFKGHCGSVSKVINTNSKFNREESFIFNYVPKIAALSDIHGQHELFIRLLKAQGIIDTEGHWSWGDGHLVINGDIFDRGPQVTETLWFLYNLEDQARAAGGYVHINFGNHELMVLHSDLRYLHPKYKFVTKTLDISYDKLFNRITLLGRWLRSKPVLTKINDFLFVHGGLHPKFIELGLGIIEINDTFWQGIDLLKERREHNKTLSFFYKSDGPVWYRGYFSEKTSEELQIDTFLKILGVKHIVVGHTTQDEISTFHNGKVIAVDSKIKKGKNGEVFIWEKNQLYRGLLTGKRILLK